MKGRSCHALTARVSLIKEGPCNAFDGVAEQKLLVLVLWELLVVMKDGDAEANAVVLVVGAVGNYCSVQCHFNLGVKRHRV